jgi:hypothetical protein
MKEHVNKTVAGCIAWIMAKKRKEEGSEDQVVMREKARNLWRSAADDTRKNIASFQPLVDYIYLSFPPSSSK